MTTARAGWLRGPAWDSGLLGFVWVPFYLWVVFGLGLGAEAIGYERLSPYESRQALGLAIAVALGFTYIHRHYTFLIVYGDPKTFRSRARAFVIAPLVLVGLVALARSEDQTVLIDVDGVRLTPWVLLLVSSGLWNVWHTVQQRYGILRVYAAKSKGGLERPEHGLRDRLMLWSAIAIVAVVLLWFRGETFLSHGSARSVYSVLSPFATSAAGTALLLGLSLGAVGVFAWWAKHELSAPLTWAERVPRLTFLFSTFALLVVFVVHGPIVGYLCFGAAHALEYLSFVHHFAKGKLGGDPDAPSVAAAALGKPLLWAPMLVLGLGGAYLLLRQYRATDVYLTYYIATSMLHFLYDGWIWKVRRPEVARPLGVAA